ncbi:MAG: LysE family transporter [Bacteroidales bacterium]|nr:LysE family transporter [Bacteroidales bacterium]
MGIVLQGVLTGLVLSIYVGATFFTIMETSIRRGPGAAIILNTGVWTSDITFIFLAYFGATGLVQPFTENLLIKVLAGVAFIVFGLSYFFRKPIEARKPLNNSKKSIAILFFKGFAINSLNPSVFIFWFGAMVMVVSNFELKGIDVFYYFASVVGTVMIVDMIKVLSATRLRPLIKEKRMSQLFHITGIILMAFGIFLIVKAFA